MSLKIYQHEKSPGPGFVAPAIENLSKTTLSSPDAGVVKSQPVLWPQVSKELILPPEGGRSIWHVPATITRNNFIFKSLSSFSLNIAVGCGHSCIFCSVPDTSAKKLGHYLFDRGVTDPDGEWGKYVFIRPFIEKKFLASLRAAEDTPVGELNLDGNRAVIICSTTDAYQVIVHPDPAIQRKLNDDLRFMIRRALELILEQSSLNVRILTRSPLCRRDFDLFKKFGKRLMLGMSIATLDNRLARIYEPGAPAPTQRLAALKAAKEFGLNVYAVVAPTFPECDEADLRRTLMAVKELEPLTIFHEPINVRAKNVLRMQKHAQSIGATINTDVFATPLAWRNYALGQLMTVERLAVELGIHHKLHLWPDKDLGSKNQFMAMRKANRGQQILTAYEKKQQDNEDEKAYQQLQDWLTGWWTRKSEWPR